MEPEDYEAMMKRMGSESTHATRPAPGPAEGEAVERCVKALRGWAREWTEGLDYTAGEKARYRETVKALAHLDAARARRGRP